MALTNKQQKILFNLIKDHPRNNFYTNLFGCKQEPIDGYSNFVFIGRRSGKCLTGANLNRMLRTLIQNYNEQEETNAKKEKRKPELLPNTSVHILRHTACTRMAENGMSPSVLQYIMGHKSIKITMEIYTNIDQEKVDYEMKNLVICG